MRFTFLLLFSLFVKSALGLSPKQWLANFHKVFIETLPVNRVFVLYDDYVFSFEIPKDLTIIEDTLIHQKLSNNIGVPLGKTWRDEVLISNENGTKTIRNSWEFRMCGLETLPTQYPNNFCNESELDDPHSFRYRQMMEHIQGYNIWSRSWIKLPFIYNPWFSIPHFEYRQCFRYSQSLFVAYLLINKTSNERFMHATVKTIIPTTSDYRYNEFEYWATDYSPLDILRLIRLMNSIQASPCNSKLTIYDTLTQHNNIILSRGYNPSPEMIAKKIFNVR